MAKTDGLRKAIDDLDCLVYGAMATAREGLEKDDGYIQDMTRFRVIEDLLTRYRKGINRAY